MFRLNPSLICAGLLYGSGMCALIYQVSWIRQFRAVFGVSTQASGAVLAIFLGALGVGAWFWGRRCDASRRPLRLYGWLELGIGTTVLLGLGLTPLIKEVYVNLGGLQQLSLVGATVVRLLLALVVIGPPTFLMGGTLPAMVRCLSATDRKQRALGLLYGANTMGAFTGGLLAAFLLHEWWGVNATLIVAALMNSVVALAALAFAAKMGTATAEAFTVLPPKVTGVAPPTLIKLAGAVTGCSFLLQELVWYRLLAPLLGGSTYTISLILCAALLGIGLGGLCYGRLGRFLPISLGLFAVTCAMEAVLLAVPFALGDRFAIWVATLGGPRFGDLVWGWSWVAGVVVFPVSFVAGFQYPLLVCLLGNDPDRIGREIGILTLLNSLGTLIGSLAGGFGLMRVLGANGVWRLTVLLSVTLALVSAWTYCRSWRWDRLGLSAMVLVLLACVGVALPGPGAPWKHAGIGVGRSGLTSLEPNPVRDWMSVNRRQIFWEEDGIESTVGISDLDGYAFIVNGKTDGNAIGDACTQVMSGLIGAALHPEPQRALVVGLGTGSTAGWLGRVKGLEQVDVVELEPAVLEMARRSEAVNEKVLDNPKVKVVLGDAREYLLTTKATYDLIFSEPSNPYRAGISSMYTVEYYEGAARRLRDKGLFAQWFQGYSVDAETIDRVYSTLKAVFPHVETWMTGNKDMILIASAAPLIHDGERLAQRLAEEPFASAMQSAWRVSGLEGFLSRFYASEAYTARVATFARPGLNSDDRPYLEFAMARSLAAGLFDPHEAWTRMPAEWRRPTLTGAAAIDWTLVDLHRVGLMPDGLETPKTWYAEQGATAGIFKEMEARLRFHRLDRADPGYPNALKEAAELQGPSPRTHDGLLLAAEWRAFQGLESETLARVASIRAVSEAEAEVLLAMLYAPTDAPRAAKHLAAAFAAHQRDPWPSKSLMEAGLMLTPFVAKQDDAAARALWDQLVVPFAAESLKYKRLIVLSLLAETLGYAPETAHAFEPLEPNVPWNEAFLERRLRFYERNNPSKAKTAAKDLARFRKNALTF